jgi:hypothetical protein
MSKTPESFGAFVPHAINSVLSGRQRPWLRRRALTAAASVVEVPLRSYSPYILARLVRLGPILSRAVGQGLSVWQRGPVCLGTLVSEPPTVNANTIGWGD